MGSVPRAPRSTPAVPTPDGRTPTSTPRQPTSTPAPKPNPLVPGGYPGSHNPNPTNDPYVAWYQNQLQITNAQYDQQASQLQTDAAWRLAQLKRAGAGGSAAAQRGLAALNNDYARLAADQALLASQRAAAQANLDLSNRRDTRNIMSDAVSRGADLSNGVAANYTDTVARNQLTFDQEKAQLDRNDAYLQALAKDYGLKKDQLTAALHRGASSLGLNGPRITMQLAQALQSNDLNRRASANSLLLQLLQAGYTSNGAGGLPDGRHWQVGAAFKAQQQAAASQRQYNQSQSPRYTPAASDDYLDSMG